MKIDHVTLAGARLDEMRSAFTAATGLPTVYGGPHANQATEMAMASFADGFYVELIGIQAQADRVAVSLHPWSEFLLENAGPCAFAVSVANLDLEIARLKNADITVSAKETSGRTRPDGVTLSWATADIGSGARGALLPFLIQDFTPREDRVRIPGSALSDRCEGIGRIVIGVQDLDAAAAQYRKAFDLPEPLYQHDESMDAQLAAFGGTPIVLARPASSSGWLTSRVARYGDGMCALAFRSAGDRLLTSELYRK